MAALSFSSNFLSIVLPTKPPPRFCLSPFLTRIPSHHNHNHKLSDNLVPLVAHHHHHHNHHHYSCSNSDLSSSSSVICPSLANANTLFFQSGYNVQVNVDDNESEERLLNRFRREVMKAGVIQESKRRRYFENKQDEKKRKSREAAKRNSRARIKFEVEENLGFKSYRYEDGGWY